MMGRESGLDGLVSVTGKLLGLFNPDNTRAGVPVMLGNSGFAVSVTGTLTETTLATCRVPGGLLGANGILIPVALWSHTNNANIKTLRAKYSTFDTYVGRQVTAMATTFAMRWMFQRGAAIQVAYNNWTDYSSSTNGTQNGAINSKADRDFTFTGQLANVADTITLEAWALLAIPGD